MSEPTVVTDRDAFRRAASAAPAGARVPVEVRLDVADPFAAYRRAREGRDGAFLETTGGQDGWGHFGVDPVEVLTVGADATVRRPGPDGAESSRGDAAAERSGESGTATGRAPTGADSPTLAALQGLLDGEALARGGCDVPVPCGAIGWLSYDVARELESLPDETVDDRGLPRLQVAVFDRLAAWECPAGEPTTLRITACPRVEAGEDVRSRRDAADGACEDLDDEIYAAYDRGRERALELAERIRSGDPSVGAAPAPADDVTFESACGRAAFGDRVRRIQDAIRAGETFQANVSHRLSAPAAIHPVAAYDALRDVNPAPYSGLLELPAADLVSASPELLLECEAERDGGERTGSGRGTPRSEDAARGRRVRTEPIAGTRPRGATDAEDRELERELRGDAKERAEHAMLVDLERNDLGKVCEYGSVDVTEYRRVDRYSEVMHLVSLVEGELREDATLADAVAATFPGGTITGAPKPRTMALIDEVEATRRGPYTGSIGLFGFDGRATLNIVIRTLVRPRRGEGDEYHLRVGAGIVHDSEPGREYAETLDKARALVTAVDRALGERADLAVEDGGETA